MPGTYVFDIEANGLRKAQGKKKKLTKLHCISAINVHTEEVHFFPPDKLDEGVKFLEQADRLIAHNGLLYDAPAIKLIYPNFKCPPIWDTLIFCKMVWPADTLMDPDYRRYKQGKFPGNMLKRQSIEAWGYRLGEKKVGADISDWETYTDYMGERNRSDVRVNLKLWKLIEKRIGWNPEEPPQDGFVWPEKCFELEHKVAVLMQTQEDSGFGFNKQAALKLASELTTLQHQNSEKLKAIFGSWWEGEEVKQDRDVNIKMVWLPDVTLPRTSSKTGKPLKDYVGPPLMEFNKDCHYTRITRVNFNPSSRLHLGKRLQEVYGWKPLAWGGLDGKQATVDEGTIKDIHESILPKDIKQTILDYFVITKTLGQLSIGQNAWLAKLEEDGAIHGEVDGVGTITMRGTHKNPNLGQVVSVVVEEEKDDAGKVISKHHVTGLKGGFGWECRDLFIFRTGEGTGTDASGLELRGLGHHLYPYDDGAFAIRVTSPGLDIHQEHAKLTGLTRAATKTITYAYVYGAGPYLLGVSVGFEPSERDTLLSSPALRSYLQFMKRRMGSKWQEPIEIDKCFIAKGLEVKKKFESGIKGIVDLKKAIADEALINAAGGFPWVLGLDGRKIFLRKAHAGLNTKLQSDGAIICKVWMLRFHEEMKKRGYEHLVHYRQVAWVHDELQIEHQPGLGEVVAEASEEAMHYAQEVLHYRAPLSTSAKTGRTWAETH